MRLQKYLAHAGIASRRKAEAYIAQGLVRVNGEILTTPGIQIDEHKDRISFNGKEVKNIPLPQYFMLHKPEGTVTTVSDPLGRPTVMALLQDVEARLYPVGRLDYDTSGLLLLTNDGALAYRLTHPKHEVDKTYIAGLRNRPDAHALAAFQNGIEIDGRKTAPALIEIVKSNAGRTIARITIREGRNRQVRKMCDAVGCPVQSLKRVAVGKLFLGNLPRGEYRRLTKAEIEYVKSL